MKIFKVASLFVAFVCISFLITACGDSGGDGDNNSDFAGSCTGASGNVMEGTCTDYYEGYTVQDGKDECAHQNDNYSSDTCSTVNSGLTKISGKCEVTDPPEKNHRLSRISFYEPDYDLARAQLLCNGVNSVTGYTGTWISD